MYYIHTMTTILRHIIAFVATAYFNQFIRPNDSIINRCEYRRSWRVNADDASLNLKNRIIKYDQSEDQFNNPRTITGSKS